MRIKLLVVEDRPIVRLSLEMLLDSEEDMMIVGEAGTVADAIRSVDSSNSDVVLMDIRCHIGQGSTPLRK